jgi:hypothetical protein
LEAFRFLTAVCLVDGTIEPHGLHARLSKYLGSDFFCVGKNNQEKHSASGTSTCAGAKKESTSARLSRALTQQKNWLELVPKRELHEYAVGTFHRCLPAENSAVHY